MKWNSTFSRPKIRARVPSQVRECLEIGREIKTPKRDVHASTHRPTPPLQGVRGGGAWLFFFFYLFFLGGWTGRTHRTKGRRTRRRSVHPSFARPPVDIGLVEQIPQCTRRSAYFGWVDVHNLGGRASKQELTRGPACVLMGCGRALPESNNDKEVTT